MCRRVVFFTFAYMVWIGELCRRVFFYIVLTQYGRGVRFRTLGAATPYFGHVVWMLHKPCLGAAYALGDAYEYSLCFNAVSLWERDQSHVAKSATEALPIALILPIAPR